MRIAKRSTAHVPSKAGRTASSAVKVSGHKTALSYSQLIQKWPLRPIRTEADATKARRLIDRLMAKRASSKSVQDYLEVLAMLVEAYEQQSDLDTPDASHAAMLAYLLDTRAVSQADLFHETGIPRATISSVLAGRRQLSKANIARLSDYFKVPVSVWMQLASVAG